MKKLLALMLAAALALSLVSCGGSGGSSGDASNGVMTKEEMLEAATECNFLSIQSDSKENTVRAEEKYCGKVYRVTGYVERIEETSVKIIPLDAPSGLGSTAYSMTLEATLSKEDILELSTWEVVNIVGEISSLGEKTVFMEHAYYVDNLITFTGKVDGFTAMSSGEKKTAIVENVSGVTLSYEYYCQAGRDDLFTEEETIQGVTVLEGNTVTVTGKLAYKNATSFYSMITRHFTLTDIETIEKK